MPIVQQFIYKFSTSVQDNCMRGFYTQENNWHSYRSEIFAPTSCIHSNGTESWIEFDQSDSATEGNLFILITTIGILLILLTINYRSLSFFRMDWFRLILLYIVGTIGVIVVVQAGASTPGFNRLLGFGILVHNFGEMYLLKHIWFGSQGLASLGGITLAILYLWIMSTFIWLLPINVFFFVAMWQGATFDYTLLFSLPFVASQFKNRKWNRISWILAATAAAIHITSIQPLFFGMSLAFSVVSNITAIFLFPTFFFYTLWAIRELGRVSFIGPTYEDTLHRRVFNDQNSMLVELKQISADLKQKPQNNQQESVRDVILSDVDKFADERTAATKSLEIKLLQDVTAEDLKASRELAEKGVIRYFDLSYKIFFYTVLAAGLASFANSCAVFWAPCYIHIDCLR